MRTDLPRSELRDGLLRRYADRLPVTPATPDLTLGEGSTPLVRARRLQERVGCAALYFKLEGCNPTGSFKDRGMVVATAKAFERGARRVICASTGNTSASAAAYAAALGIECFIVIPDGYIAMGKLAQAVAHGASILAIDGNFDAALRIVRDLTREHEDVALVNSVNPDRLEGQKTAAFEIVDSLGDAPDLLCLPVGNAGNITAYWLGFCEYLEKGPASRLPRLWGFEAQGAAPIVNGEPVEHPETFATAIRIGNPASWDGALRARDQSGGLIDAVSDDEIFAAYSLLAREEGLFAEPASAASLAGLLKRAPGDDLRDATVVCVLTGNGLKDPDSAMRIAGRTQTLPAETAAVARALGLR
jgi:threonine synthase